MIAQTQLTQVLLVFGGESSEHQVSLAGARNVYEAIDGQKYAVHLAYITTDGEWLLVQSVGDEKGETLMPVMGQGKFKRLSGVDLPIDVILPILHGKNGEDGTVQGMAQLVHVPCAGPGLIGAAMTMDKDITKRLLRDGGVPVVDWVSWHTHQPVLSYVEACKRLNSDVLFVKPANAGSSVGVSKVTDIQEFSVALRVAAKHDDIVLIEPAIQAREIEVAVLGTKNVRVSVPGEVIPGAEFYSYEDKYAADSQSAVQIPAKLRKETVGQLQEYARTAYQLTRGQGMARVDFFVTNDNQIYLNEINAIPGFTNSSMYPKLWRHDGLSYSDLLSTLISDAILKPQSNKE